MSMTIPSPITIDVYKRQPYDYWIPRELEEGLEPGMRVLVPFGSGNRGTDGIVLILQFAIPVLRQVY